MRILLYLLAPSVLAACIAPPAPQRPPSTQSAPSLTTIERLGQQVEAGRQLVRDQQFAQADALFTSVIAAPEFAALPTAQQHVALQFGGGMALQMGDPQRGLALVKRACEMSETDSLDWYTRIRADNVTHDTKDTVVALTIFAVRWPQYLSRLEQYSDLDSAMTTLERAGSDADRYTVLTVLFGTHLSEPHDSESRWWRDLALLQLARGEGEGAAGTLLRITDAHVAISIEADRRFDPIRGLITGGPSVAEIAARAIDAAAKRARDHPGELEPLTHLADLLSDSQRYQQELRIADMAIERQETEGSQIYSDYSRRYVWILDARADALYGLGRWDAAIIQEQAASNLAEQGGPNVSQIINLASMFARTGKPQESLATLQRLQAGSASRFGDMQAASLRVEAAAQLHDTRAVDAALGFMRRNRDDALGALQRALLAAGRDDEGAQLLVSRLADPHHRSDALLAVQQYDEGIVPPLLLELHHHWQVLIGRREVQEAIARVGRVGHYPLDRSGY